jgi:hypothetical protein
MMESSMLAPRIVSRAFVSAAVLAVLYVAGAGTFALARGGSDRSSCGNGRLLSKREEEGGTPRLGPLTLQAGHRGDFRLGIPYKVGITRRDDSQATLELRGWRCADGQPLRFSYRETPLPRKRYRSAELRRIGDRVLRLRWYRAPAGQRALVYTGYMLFWANGDWRLEVRSQTRALGEYVLRL